MDILYFKGKLKIKGKTASAEVDDFVVITRSDGSTFQIEAPGEYEAGGVSVVCNLYEEKNLFVVEIEGLRICVLPNLASEKLTSEIIDTLGSIDISAGPNPDLAKQTDPWVVVTNGDEGLPKYSITKDKLPADLQVVVLTSK
ncbi:hypothetical protein HZB69_02580 [Candidatus Amesbacteria bacterium]|nr:hypothetical protein [Candidatus Amesbacteria bacterium]